MAELVSETYALALFETSIENKMQDIVKIEINSLYDILKDNSDYTKILSSPIVGLKEKHELANATFNGKICDYLLNLIFVLIDNARFSIFFDVINAFNNLCDKHDNVLRATAITTIELTQDMIEDLQAKLCVLSKKNVILSNEVDKDLIGGIVLKYNNMEIDYSIKTKLNELRKQVKDTTL